ncbi:MULTISPECIES: DUF4391 domain-containing protein [Bacteroides]|uniref:DUF4391 domain-containing protein n=1 Tax=Bacteroides TaxID=816 RepID=UPI0011E3ECEA|nr:DUF4391 domain-containing protein [Bacteroides pyogenes]MDO5075585.1 DUF4391 domain-containing protein [Bacteroidales bacterium]MBR8706562.1 hypothetical protein [Bacteroides pyogenes]MBR8708675.1 hypothetical protein [Bacteroides pyogenes]MBR8717287.1 hypothetical protein [Bacteroides pyogenes]MBR8746935.1 hypothetical protein [Bacteroides pyogenes]
MTFNPLNFPASTIVGKNVPKNAFYKRAKPQRSTALKAYLTDSFDSIHWLYKLHPSTLNIADGQQVHEIDVFFCKMKTATHDAKLLCEVDMLLPRHTLFILNHAERTDLLMQPKTHNPQGGIVQSGQIEVLPNVDLTASPLSIVGHDMDVLYGNFLGQLSQLGTQTEADYKVAAEQRQRLELLRKQYSVLQKKMRKEKQFSLQLEMNRELRELQANIAQLDNKIETIKTRYDET